MYREIDQIFENRSAFNGTLYLCKSERHSPADPSGHEGRYNGQGTNAYYLADSPRACWDEILGYNPNANYSDYSMWTVQVSGTFIDVGAIEGTKYVEPKENGGWEPTQELSRKLRDESVLGFRYASRTAIQKHSGGTCFCVYQKCLHLGADDFSPIEWEPDI